jgi:multisubunit Na+/H+ antiporter MnhC subunit
MDAGQTSSNVRGWSWLLGLAAAIVSVGAGIYLLQSESASAEATVFDVLMHGIGAYFIARGLWMGSALRHRGEQ